MKKFIAIAILLVLPLNIVLAQVETEELQTDITEDNSDETEEVNNDELLNDEMTDEIKILNEKFLEISSKVSSSQNDLRRSINETSYLEIKLTEVREDIENLEEQLELFDKNISGLEEQILLTNQKIIEINDTLAETKVNIEKVDLEISYNLEQLLFAIQMLYFESDKAGFFDSDDLQTVKLLLADENVDTILEDAENISLLENYMQLTLKELESSKSLLNELFDKFEDLKFSKTVLKENLENESNELKIQRIAKENILEATKGEEQIYLNLIERSKTEEAMIRQEIVSQIDKYKVYRELIDSLSGDEVLDVGASILDWPITPTRGLSAYFKDPSYKAALGIEHYAVDIPAPSGTSVAAAAPGVVFKVKGGEGNDYHYILIGHSDGVMTLYGHMYDIYVFEGQSVERGEIIGLSGGVPGTKGAGYLTTGAHLHFEVIKDGVHVDPMPYLDQTQLGARYRSE